MIRQGTMAFLVAISFIYGTMMSKGHEQSNNEYAALTCPEMNLTRIARNADDIYGSSNNIRFNVPDLNVKHGVNGINTTLHAFKTEEKEHNNRWVSIGHPIFLRDKKDSIYQFTPESILMRLRLLPDDQETALKKAVKKFYPYIEEAFVNLIPLQAISCSTTITIREDHVYLKGRAQNLNSYEVTIEIPCLENSENRKAFYNRMARSDPIVWKCTFLAGGKEQFVNRIKLTAEEIQDAAIDHDLFGPANEVYTTRNQLTLFTKKIKNSLQVEEDYELDERFDDKLLERLISMATSSFSYVDINQVLPRLSKFGFSMNEHDLAADEIKKRLSDTMVHKVKNDVRSNSTKNNENVMDWFEDENANKRSAGISLESIFGIVLNAERLSKRKKKWSADNISINDRLNEIRRDAQIHTKFELHGSKIVPKTIEVALLHRNDFKRDISISYKKIVRKDARFKNVVYIPAHSQDNISPIFKSLEEDFNIYKRDNDIRKYAHTGLAAEFDNLKVRYGNLVRKVNDFENSLTSRQLLLKSSRMQCKQKQYDTSRSYGLKDKIDYHLPAIHDCNTFGSDYFIRKLRTEMKVNPTSTSKPEGFCIMVHITRVVKWTYNIECCRYSFESEEAYAT